MHMKSKVRNGIMSGRKGRCTRGELWMELRQEGDTIIKIVSIWMKQR